MTDWTSPSATLALSLITPCLGALLGLIIAGVSDLIARRKAARVRAQKWKGVVS